MMHRQLAATALATFALPAHAEALLNPIFQDHAVLQREQPIRIWGQAAAGTTITANLGGGSAEARADGTGHWNALLPSMKAGGPYTLTVKSGTGTQTVSDVLIGDVYLCSGQSNMAFPVMAAIDAGPDIQVSANDTIRLMSVANVTKPIPQSLLPSPITWAAAAPKTVANFSAACYFFGRDLQKNLQIPIGLIQSAWSGANITSFMSADALQKVGGEDTRIAALKLYANDPAAAVKQWGTVAENFWRSKGMTPWTDPSVSGKWAVAPQGLGVWSQWGIPSLEHYVGHVWFRTSVDLTAAQAKQAAQLSLGTITEEDQTWVNGKFVFATFGYAEPRTYSLAKDVLHEGKNDILLNVYCGWRGCGMFGPPEARAIKLADGSSVPLSGPWKYQPVDVGSSPRVPWGATAGITMAYNAMIAPLGPYGLKAVLWYQGESNTDDAKGYGGLLKAWMADWRKLFQAPSLPFLIVQLPDYGQPPFKPEESDWAELRESQRLAAKEDPHAALAVTIDIGDHMGLHPANKQEVGRRLTLAARHLIYNDKEAKPGPEPVQATLGKTAVTIRFEGINGKLAAVNAADPIGFELCGAAKTSCRFVPAKISSDTVTLSVPKGMTPTRVRYCWGDGPVCTLYDTTRLPAVPFELPLHS